MKLRIHLFLLVGLIIISLASNACVEKSNQYISSTRSPTLATNTPISFTPTLAASPTMNLDELYIAFLTTTPTAPPLPPLPPDCGTIKLGSAGSQIIDNPQKILVQGTAILCGQIYVSIVGSTITATIPEGLIDLDTGAFDIKNADFWFCPGGGSTIFYYLCGFNNTEIRKYQFLFENGKALEPQQPPFEECLGTKPYTGRNDDEAKYACVVTTLGNIAKVKIEQFDPLDDVMSVEISFVTWKK